MTRLSADDFITKITDADISSIVMDSELEMVLKINGDDELYVGPEPVVEGYVSYMQFLGSVEQVTGLRSFVREYLRDRLRS